MWHKYQCNFLNTVTRGWWDTQIWGKNPSDQFLMFSILLLFSCPAKEQVHEEDSSRCWSVQCPDWWGGFFGQTICFLCALVSGHNPRWPYRGPSADQVGVQCPYVYSSSGVCILHYPVVLTGSSLSCWALRANPSPTMRSAELWLHLW